MDKFYTEPVTFEAYKKKLAQMCEKHSFLKLENLGKSLLKREICGISLGGRRRQVLFAAGFHGLESVTSLLLIRYLEDLAAAVESREEFCGYSAEQVSKSLIGQGLYLVPMVNPDGIEIAQKGYQAAGRYSELVKSASKNPQAEWQANARGVDLNHNYNAGFYTLKKLEIESGFKSPAATRYGGQYPHSEPETRAVVNLLKSRSFEAVYAFHSQGEEIFYQYGKGTPPKGDYMAKIFSSLSGYALVQNKGLYSHGGFKDYFIKSFSKPGFTFEIGRGKNPLPQSDLENIYQRLKETMFAASVF